MKLHTGTRQKQLFALLAGKVFFTNSRKFFYDKMIPVLNCEFKPMRTTVKFLVYSLYEIYKQMYQISLLSQRVDMYKTENADNKACHRFFFNSV
jgi:hypothetical protein